MSVKVLDGQLEFWMMAAGLSNISDSIASENFRAVINATAKSQAVARDVVPRWITVHPTIEASTGKVISDIG